MTKSTKPVKDWQIKLKEFDLAQSKSNREYHSHTIHINTNDLNYLNNKGKPKDTQNYD